MDSRALVKEGLQVDAFMALEDGQRDTNGHHRVKKMGH